MVRVGTVKPDIIPALEKAPDTSGISVQIPLTKTLIHKLSFSVCKEQPLGRKQ